MAVDGPVLVTGTHRSGSTWLGQILTLSDELAAIHEPFNPVNRWSWLDPRPEVWFRYVTDDAGGDARELVAGLERVVGLRYPVGAMARRIASPRNAGAVARDLYWSARWRFDRRQALIKDPIAFFSAPWLHERFGVQPVVLIRHPAAFASSVKRLGWRLDFGHLTGQPHLLDGPLAPDRDLIVAAAAEPQDLIDHANLVWRVFNRVALDDYAHRDGWRVLRYEDLAGDPQTAVKDLYGDLGLTWTPDTARRLRSLTEASDQATPADHMSVRRDSSSAMWTWTDRLTPDEIARVRAATADVADRVYTDADWQRPR